MRIPEALAVVDDAIARRELQVGVTAEGVGLVIKAAFGG